MIIKRNGITIATGSAIGRAIGNNGAELDGTQAAEGKVAVGDTRWLWVDGGYEACTVVGIEDQYIELMTQAGRRIYRPTGSV